MKWAESFSSALTVDYRLAMLQRTFGSTALRPKDQRRRSAAQRLAAAAKMSNAEKALLLHGDGRTAPYEGTAPSLTHCRL